MKKVVLIIIIFLSITGISIYFTKDNNHKLVNTLKSKEEIQPTGYNGLAIMLQGEDGNYTLNNSDTWPTDGYVFNETLSRCENGGELSWDNGKVILKTSGSDKCYAYFDKTHPSSFTMDVMEPDFYTNCLVQVSYDNGEKWEDITLSTEKGHVTNFNEGVMLRVNRTTENYNWCAIRICEETSCPLLGGSYNSICYDYPIRSYRDGDDRV